MSGIVHSVGPRGSGRREHLVSGVALRGMGPGILHRQGKPRPVCATAWAYSWSGQWFGKDSEESKFGLSHDPRSSTSTYAE